MKETEQQKWEDIELKELVFLLVLLGTIGA